MSKDTSVNTQRRELIKSLTLGGIGLGLLGLSMAPPFQRAGANLGRKIDEINKARISQYRVVDLDILISESIKYEGKVSTIGHPYHQRLLSVSENYQTDLYNFHVKDESSQSIPLIIHRHQVDGRASNEMHLVRSGLKKAGRWDNVKEGKWYLWADETIKL